MRSLIFTLIVLLGTTFSGWSQASGVSFTAYADARQVLVNSIFELTFSLENAEGSNFQAPDLSAFQVVSGPNQGFRTTIVNGKMSQVTSIAYQLQPRRTGNLVIGSARITANGRVYMTAPVAVEVVQAAGSGRERSEEVFLEARLSEENVYVGQQLILDYVLFARVEVDGMNPVSESEYQGFFSREVRRFDNRIVREVVNGAMYVSRTIKRVVLYPQQSGQMTIDPFSLVVGVVQDDGRSRGFFFRPNSRRVPISSQEIQVNVLPLPEPQPANFSGITGNFTLRTEYNRNTITTDDALSLKVKLKGEGDLKRVTAPTLDLPESLEVYDPKVIKEDYLDFPDRVQGEKVFEYLIVPKEEGLYQIQPEIVLFNPDSASYITLKDRPYPVQVRPGTGRSEGGMVMDAGKSTGLNAPRKDTDLHSSTAANWVGHPVFWSLFIAPVFVVFGMLAYRRRQNLLGQIDPVLLRQQKARAEAMHRLETAEEHRQAGNSKAFYDEVERAMLGYVGDKLQIPRADMTKANVEERLRRLGVAPGDVERFLGILKTCEMALYAGKDNAAAMEETYQSTLELVAEIEASQKEA